MSIQRVFLMMGGACNFHCRHCIQRPAAIPAGGATVSERVYGYIERLADRPCKLTLMFWGGEPLLYWDTIKAAVARLGGKVGYSLISNGALLDDEKADYLNTHRIHFVLSNDGKLTNRVRDLNMLEDAAFRERFLRLDSRAIDAVIHAYNQDYQALIAYVRERAPGTHLCVEPLSCTWDMPSDLYDFDADAYRRSLRQLCDKARQDAAMLRETLELELVRDLAELVMDEVRRELAGDTGRLLPWPPCGQMRDAVNVDCAGNIYACHNSGDVIGTVDDDYAELLKRYDARCFLPPECGGCEARLLCRGGCPYSAGQPGRLATCAMARIRHEELLRFVAGFDGAAQTEEA